MTESEFKPEKELSVWSWSGVSSISPSSSSLTSRTRGDRSGRYKLLIGNSKWVLMDIKSNRKLGEGTLWEAQFKNKTTSLNGSNFALYVDGGQIDIFEKIKGSTLFDNKYKEFANELNIKGRMDVSLFDIESKFQIIGQELLTLDTVYLGGTGIPFSTYEKSTLIISKNGIFVLQNGNSVWSKSFEGLSGIQITGEGQYQTGGGWIGGGFGVSGALKGAAFASVINALTTRTHNDCYFRFLYPGTDGTFQVLSHTPRNLEIALSGIRNWLETDKSTWPENSSSEAGMTNVEQLEKLHNLLEKNIISKEEFEIEKKRILGLN